MIKAPGRNPKNLKPGSWTLSAIGKAARPDRPRRGREDDPPQTSPSPMRRTTEIFLIVLLVAERPEEVTDFQRSVNGEVVASTSTNARPERPGREHRPRKAKRLTEIKRDVVILLDSITRLAEPTTPSSRPRARSLGGIDANALNKPKKFFGSARRSRRAQPDDSRHGLIDTEAG